MRKNISILIALVLCLSITMTAALPASAASGDEIRAAKKIISVVYDDSGSMFGDRWVYANYALQALTALLNEQDELYITYMSRPDTAIRVDLSDIAGAVRDIRGWMHSNDTPVESLDTAKAKLESISESDPTAQFWCVIMTDGEINNMDVTMQQKLNSFKGTPMSNGSGMNVAYLAMGPGAVSANADKAGGLYTYSAADLAQITTTMSEIANLVSGRITADNVKQVDEKTFSFHSPLPLYSISVLSQQSSASVTSAASAEEALRIDRNIALDALEPYGNTDTTLFGNAAVINLEDSSGVSQVIQAGTYTITFSEPVDKKDLVVQYEPAIGLKMLMTRGGEQIDDPSALAIDDEVSISVIPVNPGTGEQIDDSTLPDGISWTIEYIVDDSVVESVKDTGLSGVTIREGENVIRGTMQIPGFAPSVYEIYFPVVPIVYNFGIRVDQPDPLTYYRKSIGSGGAGGTLTFWLTNDGTPLTKEQQKSIGVRLEVDSVVCDNSAVKGFFHRFGTIPAKCTLTLNDDGSYTLTPNPVVPFTAFLMMAGDYTVTVCLDADSTITGTGTFTMVAQMADWVDLGLLILILLLLAYLIFILFFKYKFTGQTVCYEAYKLRSDGGGIEIVSDAYTMPLKRFSWNLLLLKRASEAKFYGLTLKAGPDGTVFVTGKSIANNVAAYGPSASNPTIALRTISVSMRPTEVNSGKKATRIANDMPLSANRPIYFRTCDGDKTIWRIRLQD